MRISSQQDQSDSSEWGGSIRPDRVLTNPAFHPAGVMFRSLRWGSLELTREDGPGTHT